jgi:hypothetical protein
MSKLYNLLYKGRKIYMNISIEECADILQEFSERYLSGENVNLNELEMEEL